MKFASYLVVLIFNLIFCTFVKNVSIRKSLAKRVEKDYTGTKILNDGAESSYNPQNQKYKETLKPKLNNTKETDRGDKLFNKNEYDREYYRKNKERLLENKRNYYEKNKDKELERRRLPETK
ncbi:unnamed protein product [Meloidogyne enterolobii]|uniref:Uncharacterized protein n=1 Tax=Meloidogyne enterolobii TaxID=390850 RepID=A0ACB0YC70_MELEN